MSEDKVDGRLTPAFTRKRHRRQALKEEHFVAKLEKAGLVDVEILNREPLSVGDCALYPLFTDEVIRLMRKLIPADSQPEVAISVVVRASLPAP